MAHARHQTVGAEELGVMTVGGQKTVKVAVYKLAIPPRRNVTVS